MKLPLQSANEAGPSIPSMRYEYVSTLFISTPPLNIDIDRASSIGAQTLETFVLVFSNPEWHYTSQELARLNVRSHHRVQLSPSSSADNLYDIVQHLLPSV